MSNFLESTFNYLLNVFDDEIVVPTFTLNEIKDDGSMIHHVSCKGICAGENHKPNNEIKYITLFTILDSYLESKTPDLLNYDFNKRYDRLPTSAKSQKLEKVCYCILLIIRNTIIHHVDQFIDNPEGIYIDYFHNNKRFAIKISHNSLKYVLSYIAYRIKNNVINSSYLERYSNEYARKIEDGISILVYKNQGITYKISNNESFPLNSTYVVIEDIKKVEWVRQVLINRKNDNNYHIVIICENKRFIIPLYEYRTIHEMNCINDSFSFA